MKTEDRIWLPFDVSSYEDARRLADIMYDAGIRQFKIGLEFITVVGPTEAIQLVKLLVKCDCRVFYDSKFCDIPNTVAGATKAVVARGVDIFNVHASCGLASMRAAAENKGKSKALAVTLLTSIGQENLPELGYPTSTSTDVVVRAMATNAMRAGLDGIVCSPKEIELVRRVMIEENKPEGIILTPGVRPVWSQTGDQKRTMTPGEAIKAGATALVIGRPITKPPPEVGSSKEALKRVLDEIASALG